MRRCTSRDSIDTNEASGDEDEMSLPEAKTTTETTTESPGKPPETALNVPELLGKARVGDCSCLPQLLALFRNGERGKRLVSLFGSPSLWVTQALANNAGGKDLATKEAIPIKLKEIRQDLEGPNPTPMERLLAERASICWFVVYQYEATYANAKELNEEPGQAEPI